MPANSNGVLNAGKDFGGGKQKFEDWNTARQVRIKLTAPNINGLERYKISQNVPLYANYLNWPSDVVGNDNLTTSGEKNNPDEAGQGAQVGQLYSNDVPEQQLSDTIGNNGDSLELDVEYRDFVRIALGGQWFRVSDFAPWEVDVKFVKNQQGQWQDNGSTIKPGNSW